ncbi:hypothetical protein QDX23_06800 [Auritidibacter ignavus]|nr:hypothetical protein [Auritidibacter ignavus]WGH89853.1 hypothetical protein QDX23_06800 [Auritidibacter ignavus]
MEQDETTIEPLDVWDLPDQESFVVTDGESFTHNDQAPMRTLTTQP